MQPKHIYWFMAAAGATVGFFILTGANCYGAGQWGNSTLGRVYGSAADLAAP